MECVPWRGSARAGEDFAGRKTTTTRQTEKASPTWRAFSHFLTILHVGTCVIMVPTFLTLLYTSFMIKDTGDPLLDLMVWPWSKRSSNSR